MKLFRRLLRSLFPDDLQTKGMNPVGMFVGLISPKQFFSVIHRRLVENFKLNMFDIGLDPFEAKIGLGDQSTLKVKDLDLYYAYGAVANLNGRSYYGPGNLGMLVTMVVSVQLKDELRGFPHAYVSALFLSTYLITFLFAGRIKVFPDIAQKDKYQWFIDTYFSCYEMVLEKQGVEIDPKVHDELKKAVLSQVHVYFMLFYFYQRIGSLFVNNDISGKDFYQWLFYDELKGSTSVSQSVNVFVHQHQERTVSTRFDDVDQDVMTLVLPADIQLRYLYQGEDWPLVADHLLARVFGELDLNAELMPFLKSDETLESFLEKLQDYTCFKHNYFAGSRQVTRHKFTLNQSYEVTQEIDSFMSTIEESGSIEGVKVPEQLKQESALMDRLINFYVTFMGGLWIGRGESFFVRLFRRPLVNAIVEISADHVMQQDSLYYYGSLLYSYSKNVFHYKYAYDNVRAGKDSFQVPLQSSFKEVYSNMFILKLFDEYFVTTLLQDIQKKNRTLGVSNEKIIETFRMLLGEQISRAVGLDKEALLQHVYGPAMQLVYSGDRCIQALAEHTTQKDRSCLKENLYTLDLRVWREGCGLIAQGKSLGGVYGDMSIIGVLSMLRETLFGVLLTCVYILEEGGETMHRSLSLLKRLYCVDVLNISDEYVHTIATMIDTLLERYSPVLSLWIHLDDNREYLGLIYKNRQQAIQGKTDEYFAHHTSGEDIVRLRGYFKTVSYYNKRYLLP